MIPAAVAAVLVLMTAAGGAVWWLMRPASSLGSSAPTTHGGLQVQGVMYLDQGKFIWQGGSDTTCSGWKGYDDIRGGTEVVVTDAAGKTLAVGELQTGHATVVGNDTATGCRFAFSITGVPSGVGPYGVEVGHRGVTHYQEGHLTGLQLGFD